MSVHDETWDKCPKCKQTIKTWHGDFHYSGECIKWDSWFVWNELKRSREAISESIFNNMNKLIPNQGPKKSSDAPLFNQEYLPTQISTSETDLENILDSLEFGLELAQEALTDHDARLGRTIKKNAIWAKELEFQISMFKLRILFLEKLLNKC